MSAGVAGATAFSEAPAHQPPLSGRALAALLLPAALVPLGSTTVAVTMTAMAEAVRADPGTLTHWLVNSYLVAGVILLAPGGKLVDAWGERRGLLAGQALLAAGAALGLIADSLALLVAARVLMAAGGALLVPATLVVLRIATPPGRQGRVFGVFGACMGLAAALGPVVGGVLAGTLGWRSIFFVNMVALGAVPWARRIAPRARAYRAARFDWVGSVALAAGLLLALAASRSAGLPAAALLAGACLVLLGFVRWERRIADPVVDPLLFRETAFAAGAVLAALHNWVMYALIFQIPLWFEAVLDSTRSEIAHALMAMLLSMVACAPLGGRAADWRGPRDVVVLGVLVMLAGLVLLGRIGALAAAADALPALILIGCGLGLASAPGQVAALSAVAAAQSGVAGGALSMCRYLGGIAGIGALGLILRDTSTADLGGVLAAHQRTVWIYYGVTLLALIPAALLPARPGRRCADQTGVVPRQAAVSRGAASAG
jgi:MFS family permease